MFTHPFLERAPRFSYIFTVGIIRTIVLDTLPVVDYILVLASDVVLDGMAVSSHLSYYFVGRLQSVWAGRTLFAAELSVFRETRFEPRFLTPNRNRCYV